MTTRSWWDEVPYTENEQQPFSMQIETAPKFDSVCGFIRLSERHRVKAKRSVVNSIDRHCRIGKIILKERV